MEFRSNDAVAFRYTTVGNRIATVHGRKMGPFNDITARISEHTIVLHYVPMAFFSEMLHFVLYRFCHDLSVITRL